MKTMKKQIIQLFLLAGLLPVILFSCGEDDVVDAQEAPFAAFTAEVDETNTLTVSLTNSSLDADSYDWDFGDNEGTSTEENPTYTYLASGTYTITLTATNSVGEDQETATVSVSGFGDNIVQNGDMSAAEGWVSSQLWTAEDNAVGHDFVEGSFIYKNGTDADGNAYQWSNHVLYQELEIEAGSEYKFSADVSSESGTLATWFEVYLVTTAPVDESNIGGDATQLAIKSFGEGEDCTASPFEGDIIEIAKLCSGINPFDMNIDEDGFFTLTAEELSENGTIFLVFKAGSGFAPEGETAGFKDGLFLDNVIIKKVL